MAPNPITALNGGRTGDVVRGDIITIGEPTTAGQSRQPLLAFVFNPTSHIASAVVFIFALFTLYHIGLFIRTSHSSGPIDTRHRHQPTISTIHRRLVVAEKDYSKPEIVHDSVDLGISTPDNNNNKNNDDDRVAQHPLIMAKQHEDNNDNIKNNNPDHNPLRPKARTPTPHSGPSATVSLTQGRYTGVYLPAGPLIPRAVEAWRGIPYAESTGGANRFRPPVPLRRRGRTGSMGSASSSEEEGAKETFMADRWGPTCPGTTTTATRTPGQGEDCLNLNVYRQAGYDAGRDGRLPVVVYVHGGAFNGGAGTERDMASFVGWSEAPMVGINFNYRVGALGFPSCGAAEGEGVLNLGLRDQGLLFEWVRENIAAFGGDEGRVTLVGLSAGAHSVGYHLQSHSNTSTTAPFHRAIMESGGATARATLSPTHPRTETQFKEFLLACGIQPDQTPPHQIFPLLRALPLDTILTASAAVFARYQDPIRWPFQPVIDNNNSQSQTGQQKQQQDGDLLADLPITTFRAGNHLRVPVLAGFNTNEGTAFTSPRVDTGDDFLGKFLAMAPALNPSDLQRLDALYPDPATYPSSPYARVPPGFGRQWARYEAAYAHYAYICPVLQAGHFYSGGATGDADGGDAEDGHGDDDDEQPAPPVWIYHFAALARPDLGGKSNHVDQAAVVAHDMAAIGAFPGLVRTADAMHGAWARFIATGDPNPPHIDVDADPAAEKKYRQEHEQQQGNSTSTSSSSTATATTTAADTPFWPRFTSPFAGDTASSPGRLRRRAGRGAEGSGRVMMFGLGNDERMGGAGRRTPGVPATVVGLTEGEVERCRFWWERVELSEGMGVRLGGGGASVGVGSRARL